MLEPNAPVITSHPGGTGYDGLCGICHMLGGTDPMPDDGYHENFDVAECYDCHQTTTPPDPTITVSEPTTITVSVPPAVTLTQTGTSTPTIIMPVESTVTITQTQTITIPPVTLTNTETNLEIVTITLPTLPPQTTTIQQPPVTVTINHTESLIYEPITTTYTLPGNPTTNTATITRETTATQFMTVQTPGNSRPDWLIITLVIGGAILTSGLIVMMMVVRGR
ncbi:MAG: hypothetical protein GX602_03615 [Dehalococcoidales bacterium]|nr:hypothetical protein [Dehalococcoidales bacterium]